MPHQFKVLCLWSLCKRGLSLVEVIVAINILAFSLAGLALAIELMTSNGQLNLRHNIVYNEANFYLQQILQLPSNIFLDVFNHPTNTSFPLLKVSTDDAGNKTIEDSFLDIDVINALANQAGSTVSHLESGNNTKDVLYKRTLDETGSVSEETFQMEFTLYVTDLNNTPAHLNGYLIVLSFTYESPSYRGTQLLEGRVVGLKIL